MRGSREDAEKEDVNQDTRTTRCSAAWGKIHQRRGGHDLFPLLLADEVRWHYKLPTGCSKLEVTGDSDKNGFGGAWG